MFEAFVGDYAYFMTAVLLSIGLYGMIAKKNLMKKLIGMNIFQSAIVLFYVAGGAKWGATVPVYDPEIGVANPALYANPLPHVLMLTAIVVMVATTGVSLAFIILIYRRYKTLDEKEIIARMRD